jgi:two-component system sensor kinase FixL
MSSPTDQISPTDANSLLSVVLESAPTGLIAANQHGEIVLANRRAEELFGYSDGGLLGLSVEDLMPEFLRDAHVHLREGFAKNPEPRLMGEGRDLFAKRHNGEEFPVEIGLTPISTHREKMVVASIVDISQRKEAEGQLKLQAEILSSVHDAVMLVSPEGVIKTWNAGAEAVFGYSADKAVGQHCALLLPPEDANRFERIQRQVLQNGSYEFSTICVHQSNKQISVSVRATLLPADSDEANSLVICASDITDRKELEQKVIDVSEAEQQRIGQDIHDDLCQQLASIGCLTKVLEKRLDSVYAEGAENLARIGEMVSQANVRAREIARGLAPSMLKSEGLPGALRDLAERTAHAYEISCVAECPETLEVPNLKIVSHLYRIAQEAVNNAVNHADPRRVTIRLKSKENRVALEIEDDGSGIASPTQSSGMGLLTMAHRAQLIGGDFNIHSGPEGGTRIQCQAPLT